jgi:DNA helicase HerA-like ATPase
VAAGRLLGLTERGQRVMLPVADGRHHFHVLGATGAGKSTLLTNMILDDIAAGRGVAVIDPKDDLITDLLDRIPESAAGRIMLLDPDKTAAGGWHTHHPVEPADRPRSAARRRPPRRHLPPHLHRVLGSPTPTMCSAPPA